MPAFPSPYSTIDAHVIRYDSGLDQMTLRLDSGQKHIPLDEFSYSSRFTAWQAKPGQVVSLMIRRAALGVSDGRN